MVRCTFALVYLYSIFISRLKSYAWTKVYTLKTLKIKKKKKIHILYSVMVRKLTDNSEHSSWSTLIIEYVYFWKCTWFFMPKIVILANGFN